MSKSIKATRATVQIGSLEVDGFMLPDGAYRMSQSQASECIGDDAVYARNFLRSRTLKSFKGEGYTPETFEVDPEGQTRGQTRIQGWSLEIVFAYWVYRCFKGNKQAFSLVLALGSETLERRFDVAFGITRTENEWNERLIQRNQQLERALGELGESFAIEDDIRRERDYFERLLLQHGIDPWTIESNQENS
ncbi:MAG TPA: hypothetical protein V6C95_23580 [Coleofasciculaceae cyanobacterium]